MVKNIYKYKAVVKDDNDETQTYYFKNTKEITEKLKIPRSSIFVMIKPDKTIEKFRNIKIEKCNEPAFLKVARILN